MSKDLFSSHANQYAAFRPTYPTDLYHFIFSLVEKFEAAWDVGTGNGQVARDLSPRFKKVFATDISAKQLENAYHTENILYSVAGETTPLPDHSLDLICVAQAIHWFDRERFYAEVNRVASRQALIAVWGYGLLRINAEIDALLNDFYVNRVGLYWDKERKLIDEKYSTIFFPFSEIKPPEFSIIFQWTIEEFQGYLSTWSSVQKYIQKNKSNPVEEFISSIRPLWRSAKMEIRFPLFLRIGKIY